jgi:hypothetical protein
MFHKNSVKNQFGFYECGDFQTYSKLEVIEHANDSGKTPTWNFNKDIYSSWNWLVEPDEDLWELYRQRAQQIRDKYDHVVVMFSGGADSSNVLDVFLRNGIKVDELASYHQLGGSNSTDNYMDSEIFKVAYPRITALLKDHPDIKYRMIDWSQLVLDLLQEPAEIENFVYTQNKFLTPSNICRSYLRDHVEEWRNIIESGRSLCLVWGANKPSLRVNADSKTCYAYHDSNDFLVPVGVQNQNRSDYHDELFYNPGNTPVIACKQAHLIRNACRENPEHMMISRAWYEDHKQDMSRQKWLNSINGNIMVNGEKYFLDREAVHEVVYPYWNTETYTEGKPSSWIRNPRDSWLFEQENPGVMEIQQRIQTAYENLGDQWLKDPGDWLKGLPGWYNDYPIE